MQKKDEELNMLAKVKFRTAESYKKACDDVLLSRSKDQSEGLKVTFKEGSSYSFFKNLQKKQN